MSGHPLPENRIGHSIYTLSLPPSRDAYMIYGITAKWDNMAYYPQVTQDSYLQRMNY
jgi:hypothetical protein